jgi:hypothetical protein
MEVWNSSILKKRLDMYTFIEGVVKMDWLQERGSPTCFLSCIFINVKIDYK